MNAIIPTESNMPTLKDLVIIAGIVAYAWFAYDVGDSSISRDITRTIATERQSEIR